MNIKTFLFIVAACACSIQQSHARMGVDLREAADYLENHKNDPCALADLRRNAESIMNYVDCDECDTKGGNSCINTACGCDGRDIDTVKITRGTVTVAIDNNGNPVKLAYALAGKIKPGRPTILLTDIYFGIEGMTCEQAYFSKKKNNPGHCKFTTIAVDSVGYGLSSKPAPTALDGVEGQVGYSAKQQAIFYHTLLQKLNITTPLYWFGVDIQGNVAVEYALLYENDPFAVSKIAMVEETSNPIVSDDPCQLAFLTVAQATGIADLFAADPCTAGCLIFGSSFAEPECPNYAKRMVQEAAIYLAGVPPLVYRRIILETAAEDISPVIKDVKIPIFYIYAVTQNNLDNPLGILSRKAAALNFSGFCPRCSVNPLIPGICPCDAPVVEPFFDIMFKTYKSKGTGVWRTDYRRVNNDLLDFFTGSDAECCTCPLPGNFPNPCPTECAAAAAA